MGNQCCMETNKNQTLYDSKKTQRVSGSKKQSYISSMTQHSKILLSNRLRPRGKNENFYDEKDKNWVKDYFQEAVPKNALATVRESELYSKKVSINDFDILKVIGRGGFGKVFLVQHKESQNYYAMKSMRKEMLSKHEAEE